MSKTEMENEHGDAPPCKKTKLDDIEKEVTEEVSEEVTEEGAKAVEPAEPEVEAGPPTGIPLICGSLNWDTIGRSKAPVKSKPRQVEAVWRPAVISALADYRIADVVSGPLAAHSFFITKDGLCLGLGRNEQGQLGLGNTTRTDSAEVIPALKSLKIVQASCGKSHSMFVTEDGDVWACGDNNMGQLGIGGKGEGIEMLPKKVQIEEPVVHTACGLDFTLFVTKAGALFSAGSSENGQLGLNDAGEFIDKGSKIAFNKELVPVRVHSFFTRDARSKDISRVQNVQIRTVSAGLHHCLAVSKNNELFTWGYNGHGRLGHNTTANELVPMRVNAFPATKVEGVKMARCSHSGCFAVSHTETTYLWGQNQIAKFECPYPRPIEDLYGWRVNDLSPGKKHHVIVAEYSSIAFGKSTEGELGLGPTFKSSSKPDKMNSVEGLKMIKCAVGEGHTLLLALDDDQEAKDIIEGLEVNLD